MVVKILTLVISQHYS